MKGEELLQDLCERNALLTDFSLWWKSLSPTRQLTASQVLFSMTMGQFSIAEVKEYIRQFKEVINKSYDDPFADIQPKFNTDNGLFEYQYKPKKE